MAKIRKWFHKLMASSVKTGASSVLATLGLAGANTMGIPVAPMDWKQILAFFVTGVFIGALRFVENTPMPIGDETGVFTKQQTETEKE